MEAAVAPVLNKWGEVVGVVVSSTSEGQNLKYRVLTVLRSGYANHLFRDIRLHPDNLDLSDVEELDLKCPKESSKPSQKAEPPRRKTT
jgi:hypothetical protein